MLGLSFMRVLPVHVHAWSVERCSWLSCKFATHTFRVLLSIIYVFECSAGGIQVIDVKQKTDETCECSLRNSSVDIRPPMSLPSFTRCRLSHRKEVNHLYTWKFGSPSFENLLSRIVWSTRAKALEKSTRSTRTARRKSRALAATRGPTRQARARWSCPSATRIDAGESHLQ